LKVKIFSSPREAAEVIPEGGLRLLIINQQKITLAHAKEGYRAFDNACPHQKEGLSKGVLTQFNEVVCPLHHYRFNLKTGEESSNRCQPMTMYTVNISADGLFLEI